MNITKRKAIERRIVSRVVRDAIKAGYALNVDNGGETFELAHPSTKYKLLMATLFATDDEFLHVYRPGESHSFSWVRFVYGNDGWDVICDYGVSLEELLKGANELADKLGETCY